jgi:hypothetical protein
VFATYLTGRVLVPLQTGTRTYRVQVIDFAMQNKQRNAAGGWNGTLAVDLKTLSRKEA